MAAWTGLRRSTTCAASTTVSTPKTQKNTVSVMAVLFAHQRVEVGAEFLDVALRRHGRAVGERADGLHLHLPRDLVDVVHVLPLAAAGSDLVEEPRQPGGPLAAGSALAAAFVGEEAHHVGEGVRHVDALVEVDHGARAGHRLLRLEGIEVVLPVGLL